MINKNKQTLNYQSHHLTCCHECFAVTEAEHDGSTTGGGVEIAYARSERRNAATDGSLVQRERALDSRNRNTTRHDKGFTLSFTFFYNHSYTHIYIHSLYHTSPPVMYPIHSLTLTLSISVCLRYRPFIIHIYMYIHLLYSRRRRSLAFYVWQAVAVFYIRIYIDTHARGIDQQQDRPSIEQWKISHPLRIYLPRVSCESRIIILRNDDQEAVYTHAQLDIYSLYNAS